MAHDGKKDGAPNTTEKQGIDRRQVFRGGVAGLAALMAGKAGKAFAAGGRQPLVLEHDGLRTSVADLFAVMRGDAKVRQLFVSNPTDVILTSILPDYQGKLSDQRVSEANRFLFSLLANDDFRGWAGKYQAKINADIAAGRITVDTLDRGTVVQDMAKAMARHGDEPMMVAMLNRPGNKASDGLSTEVELNVEVTIETYIAVAAVLILVLVLIDFNVNDPADKALQTKVSASQMRSLADHLTRHAQRLKASGQLSDPSAPIR